MRQIQTLLSSIWFATIGAWGAAISPATADVVINEFMSANRTTTCDEDGHYEDWIELKNTGASPVDLAGYGLSDDPDKPFKWTFPSRVLGPGEILVVWASGKDRRDATVQAGLWREVYEEIGDSTIKSLEDCNDFPDYPHETTVLTESFDAPRNAGDSYGQRVSGYLAPPESGSYEFWISSDDAGRLFLSTDDDPVHARLIAEVPADRWTGVDEWETFETQRSEPVSLEAGRRYYMAAIMKEGTGDDHLQVRWKRDDGEAEIIPASHFIARPGNLHTNFKIGAEGEPLRLTRPDGGVADSIPAIALPGDVSYGRPASDPGTFCFFDHPTRGAENTTPGYSEILRNGPSFSQSGGFYDSGFALSLSAPDSGASVIYTLDGSTPDPANLDGKTYLHKTDYPDGPLVEIDYRTLTYTDPISIEDRSAEPNRLAERASMYWPRERYVPTSPVFKGTVVRARLIKDGALPGPVVTHTYFVAPGAAERYGLPVISLVMNEDDLFDYSRGIYTPGEEYDRWLAYSTAESDGGSPANYHKSGDAWERPVAFELFAPQQGRVLAQNMGVRTHGGWSRSLPQKSLRLYASTDYDTSDVIDYPLIPGLTGRGTGQSITQFHRFVLRNGGNDYEKTRLRDAFMQELAAPLNLDHAGSQPAVHFLNGEYWGLVDIRERVDRYFLASHHGVDPDNVAILDTYAFIGEGGMEDRQDFLDLHNYVAEHDLSDPANYAYVAARIDVDNFLRYSVAEIYVNNLDWPHNNVEVWRVSQPESPSGSGDGRWRWILFDLDVGFGLYSGPETDTLAYATSVGSWWRTMFLALLANEEFRQNFINTFADHMATSFKPSRVDSLIDAMHAQIAPYLPELAARWPNLGDPSIEPIKAFGAARPAYMRQQLLDYFGLAGTAPLTLDTSDPALGHVAINSIVIDGDTPGLDDPAQPYPWTGEYFRGVPVTLTAIPAEGGRFAGWLERPGETSSTIVVQPGEETKLTALFTEVPVRRLVHYWNFNETSALLAPAVSRVSGAGIVVMPGSSSAVTSDTGENFSAENARYGDPAGAHLRLNNPIGATLDLALPTTGFEDAVVSYETRRSGQGAGIQSVAYTIDGENFTPLQDLAITETPVVQRLDFSDIPGADDNPLFRIRITFAAGSGGTAGNNRFDDLILEARPIPGINHPPYVIPGLGDVHVVEGAVATTLDLSSVFEDVDGDALTWSIEADDDRFVTASVDGTLLSIRGDLRGGTKLTLTAHDEEFSSEPVETGVLVYPAAHPLASGDFVFESWSPGEPEYSYPQNALFVQSETNDPGAAIPLDHPYAVGDDVASGDTAGFPYNNSSRTRINGLGTDGISFINTGRGRDLGGMLVALDTLGITEGSIRFKVATRTVNPRRYGMRLQVRAGIDGEFQDVLSGGLPVVYLSSQTGPEVQEFTVPLSGVVLDSPYVQLLWRYYLVSGSSGARTEIRLDDVDITGVESSGYQLWGFRRFGVPLSEVDPELSAPDADSFGLGIPNLLQYALDIHTAEDLATRSPRVETDPATGSLWYRFPFDPAKTDVYYVVETSNDLQTWDGTLFDSRWPSVPATDNGWITLELEPGSPAGFFRLRVEAQP